MLLLYVRVAFSLALFNQTNLKTFSPKLLTSSEHTNLNLLFCFGRFILKPVVSLQQQKYSLPQNLVQFLCKPLNSSGLLHYFSIKQIFIPTSSEHTNLNLLSLSWAMIPSEVSGIFALLLAASSDVLPVPPDASWPPSGPQGASLTLELCQKNSKERGSQN